MQKSCEIKFLKLGVLNKIIIISPILMNVVELIPSVFSLNPQLIFQVVRHFYFGLCFNFLPRFFLLLRIPLNIVPGTNKILNP